MNNFVAYKGRRVITACGHGMQSSPPQKLRCNSAEKAKWIEDGRQITLDMIDEKMCHQTIKIAIKPSARERGAGDLRSRQKLGDLFIIIGGSSPATLRESHQPIRCRRYDCPIFKLVESTKWISMTWSIPPPPTSFTPSLPPNKLLASRANN